MNKKFLSAVLFGALMTGSSVTFTGCIDNDEPAGIEELRGAKAELLRAKVAVEEANAAAKNAEAALILAKAETEKAKAEEAKAQADLRRLEVELQAAENEARKAEIEAEIEQTKLDMEAAALRHQTEMLRLQEELAMANRQYEIALKQIEIAQALMSESERVTLAELTFKVKEAQDDVDRKAEIVKVKEEQYYNAMLDSRKDTVNFKRLELAVVRAKAAQATAEETLEKWKNFLKNDTETADWRKEVAVLEDSIEGLNKKKTELDVKLTKLQNSDEYKALKAKKNQTADAYNNLKTQEKLEKKDMMGETTSVAKDTPINDAMVTIGGANKDGKGGFIAYYNEKIAGYTSQRKALLDEIAANHDKAVKDAKKASDEAVEKWEKAKAAYATAQGYTTEAKDKEAVANAFEAYNDAMDAAAGDAKKELKAQQAFADAIVKYYNAAAPVQLTTNKVSLKLTVGTKETWVSKTVKEWLSDSENKDVYLTALIEYFGSAEKLWAKGAAEKFNSDTETITVKASGALATLKSVEEILGELRTASVAAFGETSLYNGQDEQDYMRVQPTQAEVKAVENYETVCGALGNYYYVSDPATEFEAKNYKNIIADYENIVKYWNDQLTALKNTQAAAKAAKDTAANALTAYENKNFGTINTEIAVISDRITALNNVKAALIRAINTWLPEGNFQDTAAFEEWLKGKVTDAEDAVIEAEEAVVIAENELIEAKDGKYDGLTRAKEALDKAMADLEKAQAKLAEATANLQKGVEIMSKTASAE
ncbi:hypothetical protein [uncultured Bacteroides sp.]|uniref:hypothetical protein n=2 Tax=uncultured Bacteroides sp. TaxID=162156 RepID=UPI0025B0E295|nr:hypothetical protein [uncultured Bacteroides sp.]